MRNLWMALRPLSRPPVPHLRDAGRARNPIDAFVLAKLTVRHNGIDRRLTDVHGRVIREILV